MSGTGEAEHPVGEAAKAGVEAVMADRAGDLVEQRERLGADRLAVQEGLQVVGQGGRGLRSGAAAAFPGT